ncbi:MAG: TonB-dependent receptor, partial [Crocinitomicaceae bacterium]|nr:TonB-dependent receptor [Crocinitomicaceae bacterium]
NFGNQVAYTPEHIANFDVAMEFKGFGVSFSNNFISGRYALNENIESNLVEGYLISNVAVNYNFKLNKKNKLKIQANVKNVFNKSYAFVRSFVMPGRNYLISLSYALN